MVEKRGVLRSENRWKKLLQTLSDKNYTFHYITLKLYVNLGLQVKKVNSPDVSSGTVDEALLTTGDRELVRFLKKLKRAMR